MCKRIHVCICICTETVFATASGTRGREGLGLRANMPGSQNDSGRTNSAGDGGVNWFEPTRGMKNRRRRKPHLEPLLALLPPYWTINKLGLWERKVGGTAKQLSTGGHGAPGGRRGPTTPRLWHGRPVYQSATATTPMTPRSPEQVNTRQHSTHTHSGTPRTAAAQKKREGARKTGNIGPETPGQLPGVNNSKHRL
jgi:hypothetical protein